MAMSEAAYTLDDHFAGKPPETRALYDEVMRLLGSFGPVTAEPKKTCIHLVRRTALGGVTVRKDAIILEFKTDYPIDSPALAKTEQISRNRWHHTLKVTSAGVLTEEVAGWLRDAYELSV
jgi:hypothetical protein